MSDDYWDNPACEVWVDPREADDGTGHILLLDPVDGTPWALPVTVGDAKSVSEQRGSAVWHAQFDDARGTVTTTPSIRQEGRFHSPARVTWQIVDDLETTPRAALNEAIEGSDRE